MISNCPAGAHFQGAHHPSEGEEVHLGHQQYNRLGDCGLDESLLRVLAMLQLLVLVMM